MSKRSPKPPHRSRSSSSDSSKDSRPSIPKLPRFYAEDTGSDATNTALFQEEASRREMLTVLDGQGAHSVFTLKSGTTWIGRGQECNIWLRDHGVSRRHASISRVEHQLVLKDNKAKNGTYVNGRAIDEHPLKPGDEIGR